MALLVLIILYPVLIVILITWLALGKQTQADRFFIDMFPKDYNSILRRLEILEQLHPKTSKIHKNIIDKYLKQFRRINHTISNNLEYYFQAAYFKNFKDRFIAFKTARLPNKLMVVLVLIMSNLILALIGYDNYGYYQGQSFIQFYLIYSLLIAPGAVLATIVQFLLMGTLLSFFSLFDSTGKIRRFSVHLDEMVKSLKPGGRKAEVISMNSDDLGD